MNWLYLAIGLVAVSIILAAGLCRVERQFKKWEEQCRQKN